jgi:hypothetical protein
MVKVASFSCIALFHVLAGCHEDEACLLRVPAPFVIVEVTDAARRLPICDAEVHWTVADLDFRLMPVPYERGCTYASDEGRLNAEHTLTVTAPGYRPFTTKRFVPGGDCGHPWTGPGSHQGPYVAVALQSE